MDSFQSSFSSIDIFVDMQNPLVGGNNDYSTCSGPTKEYEPWETLAHSDHHPVNASPHHKSTLSMAFQESQVSLLTEASLGSRTFDLEDESEPPKKRVARTTSCDSLPIIPRRQESRRQVLMLPQMAKGSNHGRRPHRAGTSRLGPPPIPCRQASGRDLPKIAKSRSMPMRPQRCPSFNGLSGLAA